MMKLQVEELIKVTITRCDIFKAVDSHVHQPRARDNELDRRGRSSVRKKLCKQKLCPSPNLVVESSLARSPQAAGTGLGLAARWARSAASRMGPSTAAARRPGPTANAPNPRPRRGNQRTASGMRLPGHRRATAVPVARPRTARAAEGAHPRAWAVNEWGHHRSEASAASEAAHRPRRTRRCPASTASHRRSRSSEATGAPPPRGAGTAWARAGPSAGARAPPGV